MKSPTVFSYSHYRLFVRDWIADQNPSRGILSEMCRELGCQNAHLTRVLKEQVHFTMDQAFLACSFLKLGKAEATYFMKLAEHDRAGNAHYRRQLKEELQELKQEQENLSKRFQEKRINDLEQEMTYYSSWHWIAVHYITAIKAFQTSRKIADRLGLSENLIRQTLEALEKFGLVKRERESWQLTSDSIHLPKTSPLNSVQHGNWRNRAVTKSQDTRDDGLHFTVVQCVSHEDFEKIKQMFLQTLDQYRKIANPSPS
ncbi:MAG: TIGR02147 family protein, partial [Pseudobdellovibrionaceae bacterium]